MLEQVRADVISAMKAGERDVAGALRLLVSELQKDLKEGEGDELSVLRREHKRRLDAASQFQNADRLDLAEKEQAEAEMIFPRDLAGMDQLGHPTSLESPPLEPPSLAPEPSSQPVASGARSDSGQADGVPSASGRDPSVSPGDGS